MRPSLASSSALAPCSRSKAARTNRLCLTPTLSCVCKLACLVYSKIDQDIPLRAQVIGTVSRITRQAATVTILTVDGRPCRPGFTGQIRSQDVRATEKDKVRTWNCFRPGDVVRAKVVSPPYDFTASPVRLTRTILQISLGDSRSSSYLSTAENSLGVLFAVSSATGVALEAVDWQQMRDPSTGEVEPRKVAAP